jgi:hypothetical protein
MEPNPKLDARTRHLLSQNEGVAEAGAEPIAVFLQGHAPFGENELSQLKADGAQIRTVTGDVLTADVPASQIPSLAEHDFVMRVEASSPLHTEAPDLAVPPSADVE